MGDRGALKLTIGLIYDAEHPWRKKTWTPSPCEALLPPPVSSLYFLLEFAIANFKCQIGLGVCVDGHKIFQLDIHIILYFEHITLPTLICPAQVQG